MAELSEAEGLTQDEREMLVLQVVLLGHVSGEIARVAVLPNEYPNAQTGMLEIAENNLREIANELADIRHRATLAGRAALEGE